jgi:uracil permease
MLGFLGQFTAVVQTIPAPVMGGVLVLLFGLIAGNGLRVMVDARVNLSHIRNIVIVSTMLVIGLGGAKILLNDASQLTGMALAVIVGVILNLILPQDKIEDEVMIDDRIATVEIIPSPTPASVEVISDEFKIEITPEVKE